MSDVKLKKLNLVKSKLPERLKNKAGIPIFPVERLIAT